MQEELENSESFKNQIIAISNMLLIQGYPSRESLINQITIKNTHAVDECPAISHLFKLLEKEESPFKIAKQGPIALSDIMKAYPSLSHFEEGLKKSLAVRVLQKCKNFYTNIKFATLQKFLDFYGSKTDIETLLFHCNRSSLISTIQDHQNQVVNFDQNLQVAENLVNFGQKLRVAFTKIQEEKTQGQERIRIFMKVKEKLDEETNRTQQLKEEMEKNKELITLDLETEMQNLAAARDKENAENSMKFEIQKQKDEQKRVRNELLDALNVERQYRAREVMLELAQKGIKKIGKERIIDLEKNNDDIDYDQIMSMYQDLLRKEREQFEIVKSQRRNDVEIWARAKKEEERIAMKKFCEEHGKEELEQIQKAI